MREAKKREFVMQFPCYAIAIASETEEPKTLSAIVFGKRSIPVFTDRDLAERFIDEQNLGTHAVVGSIATPQDLSETVRYVSLAAQESISVVFDPSRTFAGFLVSHESIVGS